MRLASTLTACLAFAACGDTQHFPGGDLSGTRDLAGGGDMAMGGGNIPSPGTGNAVDNNFGDVEPNDTPQQATPLGVSASTMGVYVWVTTNTIGGTDSADYFVFNSGPTGGPFTLGSSGLCFNNPPITSMTATLWQVQNGAQVNPPVHTWSSGSGTCVRSMAGDATLVANSDYLLGVVATGGAGGSYGA